MRFLMTAAFVGLSTMSAAYFVAANSDAHAQKSKASSSARSAVHGMAPAAPLARALQQREAERKRQAQRAGVNAGTKKMFQQRQSAYDHDPRKCQSQAEHDPASAKVAGALSPTYSL